MRELELNEIGDISGAASGTRCARWKEIIIRVNPVVRAFRLGWRIGEAINRHTDVQERIRRICVKWAV